MPVTRRILLQHTSGPWRGLREVVGTDAEFSPELAANLPLSLPLLALRPDHRLARCHLHDLTPTYATYREQEPPAEVRFAADVDPFNP